MNYNCIKLIVPIIMDNHIEISDQDQGFIPNTFPINGNFPGITTTKNSLEQTLQKSSNHQPKYLSNNGIVWKQPSAVYKSFDQCPIKTDKNISGDKIKHFKLKQEVLHPYQLYYCNPNYTLIYCRKKGDPFSPNDSDYAKNQVILSHMGQSTDDSFRNFKPFQNLPSNNVKDQLQIDSRFQSGNLYCAFKANNKQQYIVFIQNDTNTLGYNQWFYFSIKGGKKGVNYKFRIVNFKKKHSLFKFGYKLALFSLAESQKGQGWFRGGENITYGDSPIGQVDKCKYYCLSFDIRFEHDNDLMLVAMALPYSYSKLMESINYFSSVAFKKNIFFKVQTAAYTISGNAVPQITITNNRQAKRMVIMMARQHPGQSLSSYMIQGIIKGLLAETSQSIHLLQNTIIKIYPMINVDGVIYGNFRCDIFGTDLNRRWKNPSPNFHPQICEIKRKITNYNRRYKIQCCLDLHGHSKDYNIFAYSCQDNLYTCRLLPYLIQNNNKLFYFPACTFGISRWKTTTARATIYNIIKNQNVLTIQTSFYGYKENGVTIHFQPKHMNNFANSLILSLRQFLDNNNSKRMQMETQIQNKIQDLMNYQSITDNDQSGSQSQPQIDEIEFKIKAQRIFPKKFANQAKYFVQIPESVPIPQENEKLQQNKSNRSISVSKNAKQQIINQKLQNVKVSLRKITKKRINKTIQTTKPISLKISSKQQRLKHTVQPKTKSSPNKKDRQLLYEYENGKSIEDSWFQKEKILNKKRNKLAIGFKIQTERKMPNQISSILRKDTTLTLQILSSNLSNTISNQLKLPQQNESEKFISNINFAERNLRNLNLLKQTLYNEDQTNMIQKLRDNKKMIQLQKIRRSIQRSTGIAQRQGKIRNSKQRNETIINFTKFKNELKINQKIKQYCYKQARYPNDESCLEKQQQKQNV